MEAQPESLQASSDSARGREALEVEVEDVQHRVHVLHVARVLGAMRPVRPSVWARKMEPLATT